MLARISANRKAGARHRSVEDFSHESSRLCSALKPGRRPLPESAVAGRPVAGRPSSGDSNNTDTADPRGTGRQWRNCEISGSFTTFPIIRQSAILQQWNLISNLPPMVSSRHVQQASDGSAPSGRVLMLAWMNREALQNPRDRADALLEPLTKETLAKGETSGHTQRSSAGSLIAIATSSSSRSSKLGHVTPLLQLLLSAIRSQSQCPEVVEKGLR